MDPPRDSTCTHNLLERVHAGERAAADAISTVAAKNGP